MYDFEDQFKKMLDDELDTAEIIVSEELIRRTLSKANAETAIAFKEQKKIKWTTVFTIAAVFLVVVVSTKVVSSKLFSSYKKSDSDYSMDFEAESKGQNTTGGISSDIKYSITGKNDEAVESNDSNYYAGNSQDGASSDMGYADDMERTTNWYEVVLDVDSEPEKAAFDEIEAFIYDYMERETAEGAGTLPGGEYDLLEQESHDDIMYVISYSDHTWDAVISIYHSMDVQVVYSGSREESYFFRIDEIAEIERILNDVD